MLGRHELDDYPGLVNRQTEGASSAEWTDFDFRNYLQHFWHPGAPRGSSCGKLDRLGGNGDGGKQVCDARTTLNLPGPCLTLSIGSNGDVAFERSVHELQPNCMVHIMDPTLDAARRRRIPRFASFFPAAFDEGTGQLQRYRGRHVNLLKIDCEGCEFTALPAWLEETCTSQILIEVHGVSVLDHSGMTAGERLTRFHRLMSLLEVNYTVFSAEVNGISPPFTNVEYGLSRREPCAKGETLRSTSLFGTPASVRQASNEHNGVVLDTWQGEMTMDEPSVVESVEEAGTRDHGSRRGHVGADRWRILRIADISSAKKCSQMQLGFMHQVNNLECGLRLAAATGRQFESALVEGPMHTGCAHEHTSDWSEIFDMDDQPYTPPSPLSRRRFRSSGGNARNKRKRAVMALKPLPLDDDASLPRDLTKSERHIVRLRLNSTASSMVAIALQARSARVLELDIAEYSEYCNYYRACEAMQDLHEQPRLLTPSASVRLASAEIAATLASGAGFFDAVHLRQGDKTTDMMPGIGVPYVTPRDFTHRLRALLPARPPHRQARSASGFESTYSSELAVPPARVRTLPPLYVATDEQAMLKSPCITACYAPFSWVDFVSILMRYAPQPKLLHRCNPYWVVAVEQRVLEMARAVVLTDTSNIGRAVALNRARMQKNDVVRWLISLSWMQPPPRNASVAMLEEAYLDSDSAAAQQLMAANASQWVGLNVFASPSIMRSIDRLRHSHSSSPPNGECDENVRDCSDV